MANKTKKTESIPLSQLILAQNEIRAEIEKLTLLRQIRTYLMNKGFGSLVINCFRLGPSGGRQFGLNNKGYVKVAQPKGLPQSYPISDIPTVLKVIDMLINESKQKLNKFGVDVDS